MPRYGPADRIWGSRKLPRGAVLQKERRGGGRDAGLGICRERWGIWAPEDARPSTVFPSHI